MGKFVADLPADLDLELAESFIAAKERNILPDWDCESVAALGVDEQEHDFYNEVRLFNHDDEPRNQVGGFVSPTQINNMKFGYLFFDEGMIYFGGEKNIS